METRRGVEDGHICVRSDAALAEGDEQMKHDTLLGLLNRWISVIIVASLYIQQPKPTFGTCQSSNRTLFPYCTGTTANAWQAHEARRSRSDLWSLTPQSLGIAEEMLGKRPLQ
jgi:hypothetical protein